MREKRVPGWLSRLNVWFQLRSWTHGSWVPALRGALCWQLRAWSLLWILCLPLSLPLPHSCSVSFCLSKIKKTSCMKPVCIICIEDKATLFFFLMFLFIFETEREHEQGRGRERGRHRIQSRLQALSCQHRVWCGARTHESWDYDLSRSQMLNQLSHPGTPQFSTFILANQYTICSVLLCIEMDNSCLKIHR